MWIRDDTEKIQRGKKMSEDFNLSKKETSWLKETEWDSSDPTDPTPTKWEGRSGYEKEDVKEFIRLLKEEFHKAGFQHCELKEKCGICEIIDKLAGDKHILIQLLSQEERAAHCEAIAEAADLARFEELNAIEQQNKINAARARIPFAERIVN